LAIGQRIMSNDAVFKGTRNILIRDIKILTDNVEFEIERFYSTSEKKNYEATLLLGYDGSFFGPGIRHGCSDPGLSSIILENRLTMSLTRSST
jgi:hypothetical protein